MEHGSEAAHGRQFSPCFAAHWEVSCRGVLGPLLQGTETYTQAKAVMLPGARHPSSVAKKSPVILRPG